MHFSIYTSGPLTRIPRRCRWKHKTWACL